MTPPAPAEWSHLLQEYAAGPALLREAVAGLATDQFDRQVGPGAWSIRQVICHISDFEPIYADRIKRAIAEDSPTIQSGDPDQFAASLAYNSRSVDNELNLIETVRNQVVEILRNSPADISQRVAIHSSDGALSVQTLLSRITGHIPHHVEFIRGKRKSLA